MSKKWKYSTIHKSACKVIDEQTLWGQMVCRACLPYQDAVVRVPQLDLTKLKTQNPELKTHQICHVVLNYDLLWNPMRIEQWIGRVDRIGQSKIIRVINPHVCGATGQLSDQNPSDKTKLPFGFHEQ